MKPDIHPAELPLEELGVARMWQRNAAITRRYALMHGTPNVPERMLPT
jgi:hypothetical protein